ncbi:aminotransferase class I/II-fold pyridoxal phosphate-dependent enzyme [Hoeflea sp. CAU 1731]
MCAIKTAKTSARDKRGDSKFHGNIIAAETAHPAFRKSCELMDIEIRKFPVKDFRADPAALEAAIDENTFMIIGSAPCFPYGVVDPIEELSEVALRHDLWLHVDACVGGYMLPFTEELGQKIPVWDFRVPGVASISADLHKFGYAPKPASTVFFRSQEHAKHLIFFYNEWPSGLYAMATVVGTRPGGGVAGVWATLHALGHEGYLDVTRRLLDLIARYKEGIEAIPGLKVIDDPQLAIIAFTSDEVDLLETAGGDLGASSLRVFWHITLPLIAPGVAGAALFVFTLSMDEFLITYFVSGQRGTLTMYIWSLMKDGIGPRINALASLLFAVSFLILIVGGWLTRNAGQTAR